MGVELQLTEGVLKKYLSWLELEKLVCYRCGKEIKPGDEFHRSGKVYARKNQWQRRGSPNAGCRFWHLLCFEELFV